MSNEIKFLEMKWGKIRYFETEPKEKGNILMLHSNGATFETWSLNVKELSREFRLIIPDIPGYGHSTKPDTIKSTGQLTGYILEFIDTIKIDKFSIMGNSLGGIIGIDLASRSPEKVDKLVLIATPSGLKNEMEKLLLILNSWIKDDGIPSINEQDGLKITPQCDKTILHIINGNLKMAGKTFKEVNDAVMNYDYTGALKNVKAPAMIIWGDEDGVLSINCAWDLSRQLKDAPVHILKGAGHSPHFDKPDELNRLVRNFLLA